MRRDRQSGDRGNDAHRRGDQAGAVAQRHHRIGPGHGGISSGARDSGRIVWVQAFVGNLVAMEEAVAAVDSRVEPRADHEHRGLERLRGGAFEHLHPLQRGGTDHGCDVGCHGGEGMENIGGQLHDARPLDRPHAGGQRRAERYGDLTSELSWEPDADHLLDAVHQLRQLGLALDHDGQGPTFALVGHVLPGDDLDVLDGTGEVLQLFVSERREKRNRSDLIDSEHDCLPILSGCTRQHHGHP